MFKLTVFSFIVVFFVVSAISCNKPDVVCPDTQVFDFKVSFLKEIDTTSTRLEIYHPDVGSFSTNQALPFLVSIPVNVTSDNTSFYIDFIYEGENDTIIKTDIISFTYITNNYIGHYECGFVMKFELTDSSYTTNHIDSVSWVNNLINEENDLNLEIYY